MLASLIARIEGQGWSWTVGRCAADGRPFEECDAYVHLPIPGSVRTRCFSAEGPTPELALSNAEAKAIAACALEAA